MKIVRYVMVSICLLLIMSAGPAWAIQQEVGLFTRAPNISPPAWVPMCSPIPITDGFDLAATGDCAVLDVQSMLWGFNGATYDRLRTTASGSGILRTGVFGADGIAVNATPPADGVSSGFIAVMPYAKITTGPDTFSSLKSPFALGDASNVSGALAVGGWLFNGVTWDRMRGTIANGLSVDVTRLPGAAADNSANSTTKLPVLPARANAAQPTWTEGNQAPLSVDLTGRLRVGTYSGSSVNITTNTSTVVKAATGSVNRVMINVVGTGSNVRLFNDATAPCDTGFVAQLDTAALTSNAQNVLQHEFSIGICALTAGGAAADITVLYN